MTVYKAEQDQIRFNTDWPGGKGARPMRVTVPCSSFFGGKMRAERSCAEIPSELKMQPKTQGTNISIGYLTL